MFRVSEDNHDGAFVGSMYVTIFKKILDTSLALAKVF